MKELHIDWVNSIKDDLESFRDGNENDKIMLTLDSGISDETRTVISGDLKSQDDKIVPTSNDIPIVTLAPNQSLKLNTRKTRQRYRTCKVELLKYRYINRVR